MKRQGLCSILLGVAAGCLAPLDPPTRVVTPRILAIVAAYPEDAGGLDIPVHVLAHDPRDPSGASLRYAWRLCDSIAGVLDAADIPIDTSRIPGGSGCTPLEGSGSSVLIPGARTARLMAELRAVATLDPRARFIDEVLDSAGLPVEVQVDVLDPEGRVLVRGTKLIGLTSRASPTTNPTGVTFRLGMRPVVMPELDAAQAPGACITGGPIALDSGSATQVATTGAPPTWLESYPVYDFSGRITWARENAYYSFYATDGALGAETVFPPDDTSVEFEVPRLRDDESQRDVRMWLVVRDGHLGTNACFFDFVVRRMRP